MLRIKHAPTGQVGKLVEYVRDGHKLVRYIKVKLHDGNIRKWNLKDVDLVPHECTKLDHCEL